MIQTRDLSVKELAIVGVVLTEFTTHRLPRLLRIKHRVDGGERLNNYDIRFLSEVMALSRGSERFAQRHPEFKRLVAQTAHVYQSITRKALDNEH